MRNLYTIKWINRPEMKFYLVLEYTLPSRWSKSTQVEIQNDGGSLGFVMSIKTRSSSSLLIKREWQSVQTVSQSFTAEIYDLTTLLNPRRLHTTACRTLSCWSASAEKNNIIISIIKKVFLLSYKRYPHKWSAFHTKTNSIKYFMASSSATLCASQCSFAIILPSFK